MEQSPMDNEYEIVYMDQPAWGVIGPAISEYNTQQAGDDRGKSLCFVLRGPDEEVAGGVIGATYWNWLHVDLMWVREGLRGRGFGQRLLALAEQEGRQRGATNAFLDTFSFQAPAFYLRNGYRIFGELPDFPEGHMRYFLTKRI
jgi:GNAT superfamily N-acetyltransferase